MLALRQKLKVIGMRLGVEDHAAAARAEEQGLKVVMNHCPKIENRRSLGNQADNTNSS